jgi:hypothetical protein
VSLSLVSCFSEGYVAVKKSIVRGRFMWGTRALLSGEMGRAGRFACSLWLLMGAMLRLSVLAV